MTLIAQTNQVPTNQGQLRIVLVKVYVMNSLSFSILEVPLAILTLVLITSQDRVTFAQPSWRLIEFNISHNLSISYPIPFTYSSKIMPALYSPSSYKITLPSNNACSTSRFIFIFESPENLSWKASMSSSVSAIPKS